MSEYAARQALERMNLREVAVAASYGMLGTDLRNLATANVQEQNEKFMSERRAELCEAYGFETSEQRKPFAFANGMAIIPVTGTLINRFGSSWGWITGYNFIRRQLALALADDEVKGIVFDVNTYGGEAAGCFELSEEIFAARGKKPMIAVVDSNCYSAGYAIASAADKIIVTPSGGAGSIGVVAMHVDMSKLLDDIGYKITFIQYGAHKTDGNPYESLSPEVKARLQKGVNYSGERFVALVARNRNIDAAAVKATEASVYRAEEAKSLGLIDTIATPQEAVQVFFDELTGSDSQPGKEEAMTQAATQPAAQTAAAPATEAANAAAVETARTEGATNERARINGILSCEEAKGKTTFATHLAMNTSMSLDEAKGLLKVAAAEATTTNASAQGQANQFQQAMDKSQHPNLGAEAGGEGGDGAKQKTAAEGILAAQTAATGFKHEKAAA